MIDSHPNIAFGEEFEYAVEHIDDAGAYPELQTYYRLLEQNRIFGTSGFEIDTGFTYPALVNSFLETRQLAKKATHVGATIHFGFAKALQLWPNARFIRLVRDPRDVAPSIMKMGWEQNVWFALDKWIEAEKDWENFVPSLAPEQHISIRFKDLVLDYETQLKRVCEFVGVNYSTEMLSYAKETDYDVPDAGLMSRWPENLTSTQVQIIEVRVGDMMVARGFELSDHPALQITDKDIKKFVLDNKRKKVAFSIRRYGISLYAQRLLARRLPAPRWQAKTQQQVNEIEKTYLKKSWRGEIGDHTSAR